MTNIFTINEGSKVSGQYFGTEFTGIVSHRRFHTVNNDEIIFHINLDNKIEAMGSERENLCLHLVTTTGAHREFSDVALYL